MHDLLEKLQDDIFHITEAMEALDGMRDFEDIIEELEARRMPLEERCDEIHAMIEAQDKRDEADLTREYWRSVV